MELWKEKANRIIGELCRASYLAANRRADGTMRRKHVPYAVPADAAFLVECLADPDGEVKAKALFIRHAYGIFAG